MIRACGLALILCAGAAHAAPLGLITSAWVADNGQDEALVWGPEVAWKGESPLVLRARYAEGRFNTQGETELLQEFRASAGWSMGLFEAGAGFAQLAYDTELQPGWEPSYPTELDERTADIFGPVVFIRGEGSILIPHLEWTASLSWMPHDFGDFDDLGYDGSFLDAHAGFRLVMDERLTVGAGYRVISFRDLPDRILNDETFDRETLDGFVADIAFEF